MLNLLRSSKLELRKFHIEMMMTFGIAALMVAALIVWEEIDAHIPIKSGNDGLCC